MAFKASYDEDIRRFVLTDSVSFPALTKKVADLFSLPAFRITWRDEDGDNVTIATDDDLQAAFAVANVRSEAVLRIYIHAINAEAGSTTTTARSQEAASVPTTPASSSASAPFATAAAAPPPPAATAIPTPPPAAAPAEPEEPEIPGLHPGVKCDGCEGQVIGLRFKCCSCPDFDLCNDCASKGLHTEHTMLRIPDANVPFYGLSLGPFAHLFGFRRGCHRSGFGGFGGGCPRWAGAAAGGAHHGGWGGRCGRGAFWRQAEQQHEQQQQQGAATADSAAAGVKPEQSQAQAANRWQHEVQLLRDMGIVVDEAELVRLLDQNEGIIAAVLSNLFSE